MKNIKKIFILSNLGFSVLTYAAGYQIPNHSINANALATAYVANAKGADSAYYNPANMVHNDSNNALEISLNYVTLDTIAYDSLDHAIHIASQKNATAIPSLHYVCAALNRSGIRFGLSMISPAGLTRQWLQMPAVASAKEYALQTIEINPSMALALNDKLSLGFGLRYVQAKGVVQVDGSSLPLNPPNSVPYAMKMKGDAHSFGYNLALSYTMRDNLNLSATYRSKVILDLQGDANATVAGVPIASKAATRIPIPANLIIALAYRFDNDVTLEMTYDKTLWSVVKQTNFEFDDATLESVLGKSTPKDWKDTHAYRLGITKKYKNTTLMSGLAYSTNAADDQYVSFSSPESDTYTVSFGFKYRINESMDIGSSVLVARSIKRTVIQEELLGVDGTLGQRDIYVLNFGLGFTF
ncbi:MAG: outer membrane protein transport protein [Campylobacterota bacterium]|nr:outer membrane protein transport protein [Campylobacterota bacterium]